MTNETRKQLQRTPRTPITDRIRTTERAQVEAWLTQFIKDTLHVYPNDNRSSDVKEAR